MAHWLAHVPEERLKAFWSVVDAALLPSGKVIVVDVSEAEKRIEEDVRDDFGMPLTRRRLKDGRRFDVVKKYWQPEELLAQLAGLGWSGTATPVGLDRGYGFVYYLLERAEA
jgi:demethylmenaquinone methyltransferase/2-methoxy-6-polyprenyl-1,4-benzoquinol methylase